MYAEELLASGHPGSGTGECLQRDDEPTFTRSSSKAQIDPKETFRLSPSAWISLLSYPGGNGRGREPLSIATKVKTASVTLICSSPSRERRQASTWNFMDVRPVEIRSAYTETSSPT